MTDHGYDKKTANHCVIVKKFLDADFVIQLLYMDDILIVGHDIGKISSLKNELNEYFAMDLGLAKQILIMQITRDKNKEKYGYLKRNTLRRFLKSSI